MSILQQLTLMLRPTIVSCNSDLEHHLEATYFLFYAVKCKINMKLIFHKRNIEYQVFNKCLIRF
jgi:hypothetical protein